VEKTVDLKKLGYLLTFMTTRSIFIVRGKELYVYLISPNRRPPNVPPNGPSAYSYLQTNDHLSRPEQIVATEFLRRNHGNVTRILTAEQVSQLLQNLDFKLRTADKLRSARENLYSSVRSTALIMTKDKLGISGDPQDTNVAQIFDQVRTRHRSLVGPMGQP